MTDTDTDSCQHCHTEFQEESHIPVECNKCKLLCCTYCIKLCLIVGCHTENLCKDCYKTHEISGCKDCYTMCCSQTTELKQSRRSPLHTYCKKCKKYFCAKQPQPWILKYLPNPRRIMHRCTECIWQELTCSSCRNKCAKCPFICKVCDKLICDRCEANKRYSKMSNTCLYCENHLRQKVLERNQYNYNKLRLAYIRNFIKYESPRITPQLYNLFIEPYMINIMNIHPYNIVGFICASNINFF